MTELDDDPGTTTSPKGTPMSIPDPYSEHRENYEAETAVDLRKQRLRRQSDPEPAAPEPTDDDGEPQATELTGDEVFADP